MHQGKLVFSQLMAYLPMTTFRRCVAKHRSDYKVKDFSCLDQFFAMAFAQLTYRKLKRAKEHFFLVDTYNSRTHCPAAKGIPLLQKLKKLRKASNTILQLLLYRFLVNLRDARCHLCSKTRLRFVLISPLQISGRR